MQTSPLGRNQPCSCGSGRKFKHCCADKQALNASPATSDAESQLSAAVAFHRAENYPQAIAAYMRVLALQPDHAHAMHMLGMVAVQQDDGMRAVEWILRAIAIAPTAEMHYNLAVAYQAQKNWKAAALHYNKAVEIKPDYGLAWTNLGSVFKELGFKVAAIDAYIVARDLQPHLRSAHSNLGMALNVANRQREAIGCFQQAISLKADDVTSLYGMGSALAGAGHSQNGEAVRYLEAALSLDPAHESAHTAMMFIIDMDPRYDTNMLLAERRRWDTLHARRLKGKQKPHTNRPDPKRRLKLGYVSGDFKNHSAAKVFGAMLTAYDKANFEVYAYSQLDFKAKDEQTYWFTNAVDHWLDVADLSNDEFADQIRKDQIDILVDLSGFSAGNRLLVFAQKPAPIQVTAWGYAHSTGMEAMDVFFTDAVSVPPEVRPLYVEEVRYLPCTVSYRSMGTFPDVEPLPARNGAGITFGAFNRLAKVNDLVWDTWIDVLHAVPGSRLLIKAGEIDREDDRRDLISRFERGGIDPARLTTMGNSDWITHLQTFSKVDICLDPFPHGGGVTSLEALRMGIPVVALSGSTVAGRLATSIMTTLDMTDWVAATPADYVSLAAVKAADLEGLAVLRAGLRERFDKSPIGDNASYVAAVETEYRQIWQRWCDQQQAAAVPPQASQLLVSA